MRQKNSSRIKLHCHGKEYYYSWHSSISPTQEKNCSSLCLRVRETHSGTCFSQAEHQTEGMQHWTSHAMLVLATSNSKLLSQSVTGTHQILTHQLSTISLGYNDLLWAICEGRYMQSVTISKVHIIILQYVWRKFWARK